MAGMMGSKSSAGAGGAGATGFVGQPGKGAGITLPMGAQAMMAKYFASRGIPALGGGNISPSVPMMGGMMGGAPAQAPAQAQIVNPTSTWVGRAASPKWNPQTVAAAKAAAEAIKMKEDMAKGILTSGPYKGISELDARTMYGYDDEYGGG